MPRIGICNGAALVVEKRARNGIIRLIDSYQKMELKKAKEIYEVWRGNIEIFQKLHTVFHIVPESFLPYPREVLEEALIDVAEYFANRGDKEMARNIQEVMALQLIPYHVHQKMNSMKTTPTDEEVLIAMTKRLELMLGNPELKEALLENLKQVRDDWLKKKNI